MLCGCYEVFFSALIFGWWDVLGGCQDIAMWLLLGVMIFHFFFFCAAMQMFWVDARVVCDVM